MTGPWATRIVIGGLGLLSLPGYALLPRVVEPGQEPIVGYVGLFIGLFPLYVLAAGVVLRYPSGDPVLLGLILGFGLLFRLVVLPSPLVLSTDPYRYLWDGRVQRAGINPYRYPPAAPELAPLRDPEIHPRINRPTKPTIYPPGAEAVFALVTRIAPDSILAWRLFLLGSDIATGALLLGLLRRMGAPASGLLLYAWAPLAVFEGVGAGHVDLAFLPWLLLALAWRQQGRMTLAGIALGVAVLLKLYPIVLLLAWWRRGEGRLPAACAATVAVGYLPYVIGVGPRVLGFLPEYFGRVEDFNVGLRFFLTEAIGLNGAWARGVAMLCLLGVLLIVLVWIGRRRTEDPGGVFQAGMAAVAVYLVFMPTAMHPWYTLWILPFLVIRPSVAWLWFTGAVTLSYLLYPWDPKGSPYSWVRAVEYLPLWGLLAWEWWSGRAVVVAPARDRRVSEYARSDGNA